MSKIFTMKLPTTPSKRAGRPAMWSAITRPCRFASEPSGVKAGSPVTSERVSTQSPPA